MKLGLAILMSLPFSGQAAPVLLELFTSQGCSSCPPAEALLKSLDEEQPAQGFEIIPLAFHVDYWDRSGWQDPWAAADFTQRQYGYARALGGTQVYTPQALINGKVDKVGHDRKGLLAALEPLAPLQLSQHDDDLFVQGLLPGQPLWIAMTQNALSVRVPRGENAGRRLLGHAVVRSLQAMPFQESSVRWKLTPSAATQVVAFQQNGMGPVLSAGRLTILKPLGRRAHANRS